MSVQISTEQIGANAVTAAKIADATITSSQLAMNGTFDFGSGTLTVATPSSGTQAANKAYVDGLINGLSWKESVKAASTANISGTYNNGSSGLGATITAGSNGACVQDGITCLLGDRVLIKNQSNAFENGLYEVSTAGNDSTAFVLTRSEDADTPTKLVSAAVFIQQGSANADAKYVLSTDLPITIGTTNLNFVEFENAGSIQAGDGLAKSGNVLSVDRDTNSGLEINGGKLRVQVVAANMERVASGIGIKAGGVGSAELAAGAVIAAKISAGAVGSSAIAADAVIAAKIAADAVTAAKIAANAVEEAKIANGAVTAAKIGSGAVDALKLNADVAGAGLVLDGSSNALNANVDDSTLAVSSDQIIIKDLGVSSGKLAADAVIAAKIAANAVTTAKINAGAVTAAKLGANSVTAAKLNADLAGLGLALNGGTNALDVSVDDSGIEIAADALRLKDGGVATAKIADLGVTADKLAAGAVVAAKLATGSVETAKLASDAVDSTKLASNAVITAKITDANVTEAKLSFSPRFESFTGNNSTTAFELARSVVTAFHPGVKVFRNGLRQKFVASGPSGDSEYTVDNSGAGGAARVVFNTAPDTGDDVFVDYLG